MAIFSKADAVVQLDLDIKIDWLKRSADLKGILFPVSNKPYSRPTTIIRIFLKTHHALMGQQNA